MDVYKFFEAPLLAVEAYEDNCKRNDDDKYEMKISRADSVNYILQLHASLSYCVHGRGWGAPGLALALAVSPYLSIRVISMGD